MVKGKFFLIKTTRSGTTTATVIEAMKQHKKLLMVGPTKRIFYETVKEAQDIYRGMFPKDRLDIKIFRIKSNFETCERLHENFSENEAKEIFKVFPFILKPPCDNCKYKHKCKWMSFLENMDDYDIIYITTQKLKALLKSPQAGGILDELVEWCDMIFVDECSHLFMVNYQSEVIMDADKYYDFIYECKKAMDRFLAQYPDFYESDLITYILEFLETIETKINEELIPEKKAKFVVINNQKAHTYFEYDNPDAWTKAFSTLFTYFKKTRDKSVSFLLMAFLSLTSMEVYLQQIISLEGRRKIILASVNDINSLVRWLNQICKKKLLLMTDAIRPPIAMEKIFKDMKYVNIGDPRFTASKQKIMIYKSSDPFFVLTDRVKNDVVDFMEEYGNGEPVFCVFKSKKVKGFFNKFEDEIEEIDLETKDYYRGDKTIGVKSSLRKMMVFGSPQPPSHSYDYVAEIYRRAGYLENFESVEEAGKYLENYNAQSTFFQAISRVKDPKGDVPSIVIVYGIPLYKLESYLDLDVATPEIMEMS